MSNFKQNYLGGNRNSDNAINPSNGWDLPRCQKCGYKVHGSIGLNCSHILCQSCCDLTSDLTPINLTPGIASEKIFLENPSMFNSSYEGNEFAGYQLSNGTLDSRELVQFSNCTSSPQIHNDLNDQLQYNHSPSQSPSTSSSINNNSSSSLSCIPYSTLSGPNTSSLANLTPSPPNNCNGGIKKKVNARSIASPATITPTATRVEDLEYQRYHSCNGSYSQNASNNSNNNFYLSSQYDPYPSNLSLPCNLPINDLNSNYSLNTDLQFQNRPSPDGHEMWRLERLLQDVNISSCDHVPNTYFCSSCDKTFCFDCRELHKDHADRVNDINSAVKEFEKNLPFEINKIKDLENAISLASQEITNTESRLKQNYEIAGGKIVSDSESIKDELLRQEQKCLSDLCKITESKCNNLDRQLSELRESDEITPWETEYLNFNHNENKDTCINLITNSGNIYSSAYRENTIILGMALTTIIVDHNCEFTVQCYDHLGNKCRTGNEDVKAFLRNSNRQTYSVSVLDLQNGFYRGIVSATKEDEYRLMITLRDHPIVGVPKSGYSLNCKYYTNTERILSSKPRMINKNFMNGLRGIYCDQNGYVFLTDIYFHTVSVFNNNLQKVRVFGGIGEGDGQFQGPRGITVDKYKRIIVADTDNNRVQVFSYDGEFILSFGSLGSEKSQLEKPHNVATDSKCNIAVADTFNNRIQLFDKFGNFIAVTKSNQNTKPLNAPIGLYFDIDDTIIALSADSILKFTLKYNRDLGMTAKNRIFHENKEAQRRLTGLTRSMNTFIFTETSLNKYGEQEGLIHFWDPERKELKSLTYDKIPYNVAISPEGHLYVIFTYESNLKSKCEFCVFDGNWQGF